MRIPAKMRPPKQITAPAYTAKVLKVPISVCAPEKSIVPCAWATVERKIAKSAGARMRAIWRTLCDDERDGNRELNRLACRWLNAWRTGALERGTLANGWVMSTSGDPQDRLVDVTLWPAFAGVQRLMRRCRCANGNALPQRLRDEFNVENCLILVGERLVFTRLTQRPSCRGTAFVGKFANVILLIREEVTC
jgi:hypothetical protein